MGCERNGLLGSVPPEQRLNVFALVIYIPDPLGGFLDDLRRELTPPCNPHAHISVLPPRPLRVDWRVASDDARAVLEACPPFDVRLTDVRIFPGTDVVYLAMGAGASELRGLHRALCDGTLAFDEPFAYCPHVTLAQEIAHDRVGEVERIARRRWHEFRGERSFRVVQAVFVQNTLDNRWIDLAEYELGAVTAKL